MKAKRPTPRERRRRIAIAAAQRSESLFIGIDHACKHGLVGQGRYIQRRLSDCTLCLAQYLEYILEEKWLK